MPSHTTNFSNMRIIYLQTPTHQTSITSYAKNITVYTSGSTISSVLHQKNYDCLILDMEHVESMEVLQTIKNFLPERYVIACSSESAVILSALTHGVDAVVLNPLDKNECERTLLKAASYINMQEIFDDTYFVDKLTSCMNVYALQERIALQEESVLLKVSLHSFKAFQVYYGTELTNKVLVEFKDAIGLNLPVNAELFRSNEDEFSILLKNPSPSQEKILSSQLKSFFEQTPIEVDGFLLKIRIDIGIASGDELIEKADIALFEAKEGSRIVTYNEDSVFIKQQHAQIKWVKIIQEAICDDRIRVYFQPILDNSSDHITKYEVLCRIEGKDGSLYQPQEFIPSAIVAGRMSDITRVVIDKSFKYFKDNSYAFSINATLEDFEADYLVDYIEYKCDFYGIDPSRIYIEILENISTEATSGCIEQIQALKEMGCNISIDDFGVDSANFSRMMQIQAEVLKIDGHFIQHLLHDKNAKIIVENIVQFSQKMGAKTVAEYVDSKELLELVKTLGIDYSQGFYIGEPAAVIQESY